MAPRVRVSIQSVVADYDNGNKTGLENLIRAFRAIQALPPSDPDSFESIAGYHGEPFTEAPPKPIKDYWGGYCQHDTILFPTWHRALVLRFERALQNKGPDPNLSLPFWDECAGVQDSQDPDHPIAPDTPVPPIFTSPVLTFQVDGSDANPLYSYSLQQTLIDDESGLEDPGPDANRYTKQAGYQTLRYPMSGLMGTEQRREATLAHNMAMDEQFPTDYDKAGALNANVKAWLQGTVIIPDLGDNAKIPDHYSIYNRYVRCLNIPFYELFSNKTTKNAWLASFGPNNQPKSDTYVSLEEPHNAIHLSVGGFYQPAIYNADSIKGANGDMGENNTAAFDPIFFFHHCFVDYVFWQWQIRQQQTSAITLKPSVDTAGFVSGGHPGMKVGTLLDLDTPLAPILKPDATNSSDFYTSNDVIDIENQLGYTYGPGSLTAKKHPFLDGPAQPPSKLLHVHGGSKGGIPGSFIMRTFIDDKNGRAFEIGRTEVLSRYKIERCANCQNHMEVTDIIPLHKSVLPLLKGGGQTLEELNVRVFMQTHDEPVPTELKQPVGGVHWTDFEKSS